MIIKVEKQIGTGESTSWELQKEAVSKEDAVANKKAGERVHVCYHDENPPRPCKVF